MKLNKALRHVIGLIYEYRSLFVHNSRMPLILEKPDLDGELAGTSVLDLLHDEMIHIRDFSIEDLEESFECAYKRWFNEYLSEEIQNS